MTVSGVDTHHGGGPSHAGSLPGDPHEIPDADAQPPQSDLRNLWNDFLADFGIKPSSASESTSQARATLSKAGENIRKATDSVYDSLAKQTGVDFPRLSEPVAEGKGAPKFEFQDRDLTQEEKVGAWGLAILLASGFIAAGLAKRDSRKKGDDH